MQKPVHVSVHKYTDGEEVQNGKRGSSMKDIRDMSMETAATYYKCGCNNMPCITRFALLVSCMVSCRGQGLHRTLHG